MSRRDVVIIGAGKRVQEAVLPVLSRLEDRFSIRRIYSRTGRPLPERPTEKIEHLEVRENDLVYLAVSKDQVPPVLERLAPFTSVDLLMETPVLLFKHFGHADRLKRFRNVWVAEDCACLPCFDAIREALGELVRLEFHHSAYKYHGLATAKVWLGGPRITSARRRKTAPGVVRRTIRFSDDRSAVIDEPRDYATGSLRIEGREGSLSDGENLTPVIQDGACKGFRAKEIVSYLDEDESNLMTPGASVTAMMDDMKRVGLYRMLKRISDGGGGYPLIEALDDMVADYYLDRLGFFHANPLMSIKTGSGAAILRAVTRLVSR
jgi:hypothetical protein